MLAFSMSVNARGSVAQIRYGNALCCGKRVCGNSIIAAYHCKSGARNGVGRCATLNVNDSTVSQRPAYQRAIVVAFFAIAHGKLCIGCEKKVRVLEALAVVRNIFHARFFCCTEKKAQVIGECHAKPFPNVHSMQRNNNGSLVIGNATPQQKAVFTGNGIRFHIPARTCGNNVHMADDADLATSGFCARALVCARTPARFSIRSTHCDRNAGISRRARSASACIRAAFFTQIIRVPDIAIHIVRLETHATCDFKRSIKRATRPGPKRRFFLRVRLAVFAETGNGDKRLQIRQHVFPMLVYVCVDNPINSLG